MIGTDGLISLLRSCLSDRYDVIREIGHGGMAVVYLATERRHDRPAAIKVMKPELAGVVGAARFLREIAVVAHLDHPHILSLYDSGEVAGLPYYVMRYVEGESLHSRILREKQLSLEETVEFTRQVALALDYAHTRGIIHRDIKPQNILLSAGGALVADFGVSLALAATGAEKLTGTGIAVGSPEYMSPEQAAGADYVDHRSDIYSLGCVVYEMLVGEPPFGGRTPQAVAARHGVSPVPDLCVVRSTVPPEMQQAVKKALAKVPADRFRTASDFAQALRTSLERPAAAPWTGWKQRRMARRIAMGVPLVIGLAVAAVALARRGGSGAEPRPPGGAVAVLPFHFSGVVDSTVLTPDAAAELVSNRLTGAGVLPPVDPAVVVRQWRGRASSSEGMSEGDALHVAAALGADYALIGTVQGTPSRIVLNGSLYAVPRGEMLNRVEGVSGPPDSMVSLLDRFVGALLLQRAGEGWRRWEELTTGALEAVKPYVAGLENYRRGRYTAAVADFERALQADPGFALARVRIGVAHRAGGNIESELRAFEDAWAERSRLSPHDRMFLMALLGNRHPAPTSYAGQLRTWEWVADSLPDYWEGAYELGDMLLHWGPMLGKDLAPQRARVAFQQALRTDSAFAPALEHLIDLAAIARDTVALKQYGRRYLTANPDAEHADYVRWRLAVSLADSTARRKIRSRFGTFSRGVLEQIVGTAQLDGIAIDDAVAAVAELQHRSRNEYDLWSTGLMARELALNRGRPSDVPREVGNGGFTLPLDELFRVVEALYWAGDRPTAERLIASRQGEAEAPLPRGAGASAPQYMKICTVGLWELAEGEVSRAAPLLARLRAVRGAEDRRLTMYIPVCSATLEARFAAITGRPDARRRLESLDSLLRSGPVTNPYIKLAAGLTLSELRERNGELAAALAAVRQRPYHHLSFGVAGLSELLLREGRLAARTGDTAGAIRSFEHFLRLRADAEPAFRPENERVRSLLAGLKRAAPERRTVAP
jgi:tetratricopeptide (TPR) repeat protein